MPLTKVKSGAIDTVAVGNITATNLQSAIAELESEKQNTLVPGDITATSTTFTPVGSIAAPNVQAAPAELFVEAGKL